MDKKNFSVTFCMKALPNARITFIDDETLRILVMSNQWDTNVMAGEEVNVNLLFEQKDLSVGISALLPIFKYSKKKRILKIEGSGKDVLINLGKKS
ncbi:MAG: hypothetical protein PUP91_30645 [Rhizonema sp. PD37]|nr:hypothetical protein [Rhizonema sp. PD37]